MKARILDRADVLKIVDLLRQQGYEVVAPFCGRGRDTYFDAVTDQNRDQVQTHFANPYYPPKRYVLPHIEPLLKVTRTDGNVRIEPIYEEPKRAIFGIRSCDVAGIYHLDLFYLGGSFRDIYYDKHRKNLFLVNMVCTDPDRDVGDECFCVCADTGPAAADHFDLQLMDLGDEFMAVAGTPAGEKLLADPRIPERHGGAHRKAPRHPRRSSQAFQNQHQLVLRHRALHFARRSAGEDLGRDRQSLH